MPKTVRSASGQLTWWADLHHDSHTHPFVQPTPGASGNADRARARRDVGQHLLPLSPARHRQRRRDHRGHARRAAAEVAGDAGHAARRAAPHARRPAGDRAAHLHRRGRHRARPWRAKPDRSTAATTSSAPGTRLAAAPRARSARRRQTPPTPPPSSTPDRPATRPRWPSPRRPTTAAARSARRSRSPPRHPTATAALPTSVFFDGATAIGSADASAPYSVSWTPSSAGTHTSDRARHRQLRHRRHERRGDGDDQRGHRRHATADGGLHRHRRRWRTVSPARCRSRPTRATTSAWPASSSRSMASRSAHRHVVAVCGERRHERSTRRASMCCACARATAPATHRAGCRAPCASAARRARAERLHAQRELRSPACRRRDRLHAVARWPAARSHSKAARCACVKPTAPLIGTPC